MAVRHPCPTLVDHRLRIRADHRLRRTTDRGQGQPGRSDRVSVGGGAVLRRRGGSGAEPVILRAAGLALDPDAHEAWRADELLDLTPTEFALLELFLRHPRRAFTRETLFNRIWGFDHVGDTNVVDVHISNLREKIGDDSRRLIRTIYGVGYSLRPDDDASPA